MNKEIELLSSSYRGNDDDNSGLECESGCGHDHHHHHSHDDEYLYDMINKTIVREVPKIGRNDPCVCGSGKKYKKCCLGLSGEISD